ncbi:XF1762 family protein [Streptomyces buecherae]|uniref:XF1762 family protein n=1 Tax=Streptomyces buecherae TaxID=2763006 RepID=UPI0035568A88
MRLIHVRPLTLRAANSLVARWHRHHSPVQGHRFSIGLFDANGKAHGAAIVGRPVARLTPQDSVAEVTRLVTDGIPNGCSKLYGAAARTAHSMGFEYIQTFILCRETGVSLMASGWVWDGASAGGSWNRPSRNRQSAHPEESKQRWAKQLNPPWPRP